MTLYNNIFEKKSFFSLQDSMPYTAICPIPAKKNKWTYPLIYNLINTKNNANNITRIKHLKLKKINNELIKGFSRLSYFYIKIYIDYNDDVIFEIYNDITKKSHISIIQNKYLFESFEIENVMFSVYDKDMNLFEFPCDIIIKPYCNDLGSWYCKVESGQSLYFDIHINPLMYYIDDDKYYEIYTFITSSYLTTVSINGNNYSRISNACPILLYYFILFNELY